MRKTEHPGDHQKFEELCALAQADALDFCEQMELRNHLQQCDSCRAIYEQYRMIGQEGMRFLSGEFEVTEAARGWDSSALRDRLLHAVEQERLQPPVMIHSASTGSAPRRRIWIGSGRWAAAAVAACALLAVALGAYRFGERKGAALQSASAAPVQALEMPVPQMHRPAESLPSADVQVARLEQLLSAQHTEVDRLSAALKQAEERANQLAGAGDKRDADRDNALRQLAAERDKLAGQLAESQDANKSIQASLASLRSDHDEAVARAASLESKVAELSTAARDQGRRLKDDEQYLSSDRDIRELMGARKLYIADVFDVDSVSRTRKPFGRVFYTQNKSLVFYAFDLDHQPGVKNASAFQVWGQKDSELNAESHPMNLGILYEDSETNRRWVLRTDDTKQLAEIDAVFVTVEPHGGSQKPTGKPFLYALLRKEANHP